MSIEQHVAELGAALQQQQNQLAHFAAQLQQQQAPAHAPAPTNLKPAKPEPFRGYAKDNADLWVWSFEQFLSVCRIADADKVPLATTFLKEAAASWWKSEWSKPLVNGVRTLIILENGVQRDVNIDLWPGFKAAFLARFRPLDASRAARTNLFTLRQTGSVQEYTNRFLKEMQLIHDMDSATQLSLYSKGLKPAIQIEINKADLTDLSQAMNLAARIDAITFRPSSHQQSNGWKGFGAGRGYGQGGSNSQSSVPMELGALMGQADSNGDVTVSMDVLNALFNRSSYNRGGRQNRSGAGNRVPGLSKDEFDRLSKEGKCFRCKQAGHLARDCTARSSHQHTALTSSPLPSTTPSIQQQSNSRAQ